MGAAAGGSLEDHRFSASSSYDEASVGPEEARYVFLLGLHMNAPNVFSRGRHSLISLNKLQDFKVCILM